MIHDFDRIGEMLRGSWLQCPVCRATPHTPVGTSTMACACMRLQTWIDSPGPQKGPGLTWCFTSLEDGGAIIMIHGEDAFEGSDDSPFRRPASTARLEAILDDLIMAEPVLLS